MQALPARLEVMTELVDEDEQDEADREAPAPDQRVGADREEDPEELERERAELDRKPGEQDERGGKAPRPLSRRPPLPDRVVDLRLRRLTRGVGIPVAHGSGTALPSTSSDGLEKIAST